VNLASMALGAFLVVIGVLASALADRIRGIKIQRAIIEPRRKREPEPESARVTTGITDADKKLRESVVAALVQSGFGKPEAQHAALEVPSAQRASLEAWTRAALRKLAPS